jgi:lambda repressor-like predicted transcriptional regulator
VVALGNADLNNFIKALRYKNSIDCKTGKIQDVQVAAQVYDNQFPVGAEAVTRITQQQKRHFSQDEVDQMVSGYVKNGSTVYQLADKFGCNRNTVSKVLKRNGVNVTIKRMDEAIFEEAKRLYNDGFSLKRVGQQLGFCESTIRKTLMAAGVTMKAPRKYTITSIAHI